MVDFKYSMSLLRRTILTGFGLLALCLQGRAVVLAGGDGSTNSTSPSTAWGDQGWSYVGQVNGGSGVYLGEYGGANWVLTAGHVFNDGGNRSFSLNGSTYAAVTGSGVQISGIDLYVYQITVGSGTGLSLLANLSLSSAAPVPGNPSINASSDPLCMIGYGRDRAASVTYWKVNTSNPSNWTWTETNASGANAAGVKELSTHSKRWGYNYAQRLATVNGTAMVETEFLNSSVFGTQASVGDSGGGVFKLLDNGNYELAGIMDLVTVLPNQPANTAILNNSLTYSIDVASYRSAILDAVPEPASLRMCLLAGLLFAMILRRRFQATSESR
jgi:hypothetical protein